jgi:hypothetical protein
VADVTSVIIGCRLARVHLNVGVSHWTMMISMIRSATNVAGSASLAANFEKPVDERLCQGDAPAYRLRRESDSHDAG